jgi:hypothetical protein
LGPTAFSTVLISYRRSQFESSGSLMIEVVSVVMTNHPGLIAEM